MIVIGFAGPARVGKTHVTNALREEAIAQGWDVKIIPFAQPLKDEAQAQGFGKEENPTGYRQFCQEEGAARRAENPNHWLDKWYDCIKAARKVEDDSMKPLLVIADDVRYDNELGAIRKNGGNVVFLHPGERELPEASAEWRTHESEMLANTVVGNTDMHRNMFDFVVMNDNDEVNIQKWAEVFFREVLNFPGSDEQRCDCEGCMAKLENRPIDQDEITNQLKDLLDSMAENLDLDLEDDDEQEDED